MAKVMKAETAGAGGALDALRELIGQLQEQAKQGQIDGALLDQAGAILDVSVDTPNPAAAHDALANGADGEAGDVAGQPVDQVEGQLPSAPAAPPMEGAPAMEEPSSNKFPQPEAMKKAEDEPITVDEADSDEYGGHEVPSEFETPTAASGVSVSSVPSASSASSSVKKVAPMTGRPPIKSYSAPNLVFDQADELRAKLPDFIKALEVGSVKKAQEVAGKNQVAFDSMLNMAMHTVLSEGGWTTNNMSKLAGIANNDVSTGQGLAKAVTASSVPGIYLIKLAKLMLPVYAGLVNRIPTQSPQGMSSNQATWRAQLGFGSINEYSGFRTAEAAIGAVPPTNFLTFNAPFADISYNDSVTLKAIAAGRGYSDPLQISVIKTMAALLRLQERVILGSNAAAIAKPTAVTTSGSTTTLGTITTGSYIVGVTALTYEGWLSGAVGGTGTVGETAATYASELVTGGTGVINVTWPAVPGAVAYNLYIGTTGQAGSLGVWNKTVFINKAQLTAAGTGAVAPVTGTTVNAYGQESLIQWCEQSTVYSQAITGKVVPYDNAGAGLTAQNGGIAQFDYQLAQLWSNWHIAPSVMVMSPNMNACLVGKLMSLNNSSLYRIEVSQERGTIAGGAMVTGYVNKFAPFADGTPRYIDVIPHPYMPDGTVLFMAETIPYPMGNETRGFVRDVLLPYTYFPLASSTVQYNYTITTSETLESFNPSAQTAIQGIDWTA
jgi:hypothetical protein